MGQFKIADHIDRTYPMGLAVTDRKIHISVAASGNVCRLLLYHKGENELYEGLTFPEEFRVGDVFRMTVECSKGERLSNLDYCFEVDGKAFSDPRGKVFRGREVWGDLERCGQVLRSPVLRETYDWEGDQALHVPYEDCIIYRAHVRGFTRHSSSGVREKGTFKALQEKIPYLKELGITTVELLPINEFEEVMMPEHVETSPYGVDKPTGKLNYWGYTEGQLFAPKTSYASKGRNPEKELKDLVKALHQSGIELVTELFFTGKENPAYALDAVRYWIDEYHLDGIHLVGVPPVALIGSDPYAGRVKLWATSWDGVDPGQVRHLGEYHDGFMVDMRKVLKGDEDEMNHLAFRVRHNSGRWGVINYMANTNGFTLMDLVSYDSKHNEANGEQNQDGPACQYSWNCGAEGPTRKKKVIDLRKKQLRNAILLLCLSQGTPLLLAGDEFGKSQNGNNNPYCQDNEITWLNWNQLKSNHELYEFVQAAIAFRKAHPVFRGTEEPKLMDYMACGQPDLSYHGVRAWCPEFDSHRRQLGILYCGVYGRREDGSGDNSCYLAVNMHWEPHTFDLPNLPKGQQWHVAFNTDDGEAGGRYPLGQEPVAENKQIVVPPRTVLVLLGVICEQKEPAVKKVQKSKRGQKSDPRI